MSIKSKFEKIDLEKLKSENLKAYEILNGWAKSTKNFTDDEASEVVEPLFNKLYDKIATGKLWYVIEGNKQPKDQVAEPVTKKEEEAIVKQVVKSEPKEPKVKATKTATKTATKKTHTSNANKVKHVPTPPKLGGKSVFEVAKELREKDPTLKQRDAVRMAGKMVKDAHNKAKDEELQSLMKMIKSDPRYSVLRPDKNTSIIRDLGRPAIRTTKRVSRKGWKNQYGASDGGRTYYENRVNRMDVDKVPMYAKGGQISSNFEKSRRFTDYDFKKLVDEDFYATWEGNYWCIKKENGGKEVAKFYPKKEVLVANKDADIFNWLKENSYLSSNEYAKGGELAGVVVYDNGGESFDRYTIFTPDGSVYGMSENASGFNMYIGDDTEIEKGSHLGKKLKSVPEGIKKAVLDRMSETFAKGGVVGLMDKLKAEGKLVRYLDVRGDGKKVFDIIVPNKEKKGYFKRYESLSQNKLGALQNEYLDEGDVLNWLKKTSPNQQTQKVGRTHGSHLPTSDVEYFRKGKIDKLMIGGKEISEDDILSGVFAKKFAKGGEVVGDYSILAYKSKGDFEDDTDERYFGMKDRSLDYVIDEFDSRVDSGLFYGYKITKSGDFANVIYQSSRDSKGGVSKRLEKTGKDYRVLGYKTKADFNDLDDAKYSGVTDRSLEYTKNLFDEKIKSGMWYGYQIFESGDMRNPIYTNTKDGKFAKGGKVAKFDAYEVQEKLADLSYKVWEDLDIDSGSAIYESDAVQKKMASAYKKAGIDDLFTQYTESERKEIAEALTDENQHTLRQYLALRGYRGDKERQDYIRLAKKYNVGGRKSFLEPKNIEVAKTTATSKSGGKQGYVYVPKEDITSIEYMKDGESVIAKNTDILDGAYIKISSSSFAKGGRLPKGEVMYVPKNDIQDIVVSDSGFKAHNITDELLSGVHIKASALSNQPASQSTPSKSAKFGTTRIYKGYNGWVGRTSVNNVDGADYEIVTMKRSNGKLWSNAQKGKNENGIFSYMVFGDDNTSLIETKPAKVTEKAVSEQHEKAIAKFKEMKGL